MDERYATQVQETPLVRLRINPGENSEHVLEYRDHQTITIGRSKNAGLSLTDDPAFSRFHCRLELNPPTCSIIDLGSRNGTKINGQRIQGESTLSDGDEITLGQTSIQVEISGHRESWKESDPLQNEFTGYRVLGELGRGAMGIVYRAQRLSTREDVAIKVIQPAIRTDETMLNKFQREASLVLRLQHKRIVKAIDFQVSSSMLPYLVMEYLDTVDFEKLLKEMDETARIRRAVGITCHLLEALQFAHDMEIVHRDVKPGNILAYRVGGKMKIKLADFGLAKNYIDAGFTDCSHSNETCGTLSFMAPEQVINCRHAKPTCDIYSAAACLYKLISGQAPFQAESLSEMVRLILNESPQPIRKLVPAVPLELETVIAQGMSREVENRFQSASGFRKALLPFSKSV